MRGLAASAGARWMAPTWHAADSRELEHMDAQLGPAASRSFDCVFSCPPYYDLERYSDDARDLSEAHSYATFLESYQVGSSGTS